MLAPARTKLTELGCFTPKLQAVKKEGNRRIYIHTLDSLKND